METNFNNLTELKKRVTPVLNTKVKELRKHNYLITTTDDIWQYLKETKWKTSINLTLYDMVNDILRLKNDNIEEYAIKRSEENDKN